MPGYVSVTPTLNNNPSTSALNFPTGDTRANNITSPLSGGKLSIVYKALTGAKADILLDVTGYFIENITGATYNAVTPVRLLDSRSANGLTGPIPTHTVKKFTIRGRGGIPAGATAVTGNFTVVGQNAAGYATLGPTVTDNPTTSTINFPLGDTGRTASPSASPATARCHWCGSPQRARPATSCSMSPATTCPT